MNERIEPCTSTSTRCPPACGACRCSADDRAHVASPLERGERHVARIRLGLEKRVDPRPVPAPDTLRVAAERVDRRHLERVDVGPETSRRAEVRDPALGAHARTGEDDRRAAVADQPCELGRRSHAAHRRWEIYSPVLDGFRFSPRRPRPVRGDGRAGHRAPRVLRRLARGRARRVPERPPAATRRIRERGIEALTTAESHSRYDRPARFDDAAHVGVALPRHPRCAVPLRVRRSSATASAVADGWTRTPPSTPSPTARRGARVVRRGGRSRPRRRPAARLTSSRSPAGGASPSARPRPLPFGRLLRLRPRLRPDADDPRLAHVVRAPRRVVEQRPRRRRRPCA